MRRALIAIITTALVIQSLYTGSAAQSVGQFCLLAFEDRNADGFQDANEPPLTGGISATLLNVDGIIVASALLDNSPRSTEGIICFAIPEAGVYTLRVTSADYRLTTLAEVSATVSTTGTVRADFGARRLAVEPAAPAEGVLSSNQAQGIRLLFAAGGALLAMAVTLLIGLFLYLLLMRRRPAAAAPRYYDPALYAPQNAPAPGSTAGSLPAARATRQMPVQRNEPDMRLFELPEDDE